MKRQSPNALMPALLAAFAAFAVADAGAAGPNAVYSYTVPGHNAPMTVDVIMKDGRIEKIITDARESPGVGKDAIRLLASQMIGRQTVAVDAVTGATVTSFALRHAVTENLREAGADLSKFQTKIEKAPLAASYDTEVAIVGGGGAGLVAAAAALEAGGKVVIIEKLGYLGGSTVVSGGGYNAVDPERQNRQGIEDSVEKFFEDTMRGGHETNDPELVRILTSQALEGMHWMEGKGLGFGAKVNTIVGGLYPRGHSAVGGGFGYVNALKRFIASYPDRVTVLTDTTAKKLVKDASGRVVGVEAEHDGKKLVVNAAKGVVITTGGFAANVELRQKVNTGVWKELVLDAKIPSTNNFKASQGEGLKLAEDAGAALINLSDIQLHPGGAPKTGIMSSWPSGRNRIFLNNAGERFVNEDAARDTLCKAIFAEGGEYWILSNHVKYPSLTTLSKLLTVGEMIELGQAYSGETLDELAKKTGMDPAKLKASVEGYNAVVTGKVEEDEFGFKRATSDDQPMTEGPYYATPMVPAVHHTMGGIRIDGEARVLDAAGKVIPGLWAAGEVTGGVHGANRVGGNGIADVVVFGRIAGTNAAEASAK